MCSEAFELVRAVGKIVGSCCFGGVDGLYVWLAVSLWNKRFSGCRDAEFGFELLYWISLLSSRGICALVILLALHAI